MMKRILTAASMILICGAIPVLAANIEQIDVQGAVTRVYTGENEIDLRASDGDYIIVVRPQTVIQRYIYPAEIGDIREGDQLGVNGTLTGGKIYADRIQISKEGRGLPSYYREDVIEGMITFPPSSFDRSFALETVYGERKVDVRRGAAVTRNGRDISVHDLAKGDKVRAYGTWDGRNLDCARVEVIDEFTPSPIPPASDEPAAAPPPAEPPANPPAADNAPELQPEQPSTQAGQPSNVRTGRIIAIDYAKFTMTIDSAMNDIKIDAQNAAVTRKESTRRFSDLKQGDKVTVTGELVDGGVKATAIEIVD